MKIFLKLSTLSIFVATILLSGCNSIEDRVGPINSTKNEKLQHVEDTRKESLSLVAADHLKFISITAGGSHSCGISTDRTAYCWGANSVGQLGDGSTQRSLLPVKVSKISRVQQIVSKAAHTCALLFDGSVRCWGYNSYGQLGDGTISNSNIPVEVKGLTSATKIAVGHAHSCAVMRDGRVSCWGTHNLGVPGLTSFNSSVPIIVDGIDSAIDISLGRNFTCALHSDGKVSCWGSNVLGQIGNSGFLRKFSDLPISVDIIRNAESISSALFYTCALLTNGEVSCWNAETILKLFNKSMDVEMPLFSPGPSHLTGIHNAKVFVTGIQHSCAVMIDGKSFCWGWNKFGQLGAKTETEFSPTPQEVRGLNLPLMFALGDAHTCALLENSSVRCWGNNSKGQLGNGKIENSSTPVLVGKK